MRQLDESARKVACGRGVVLFREGRRGWKICDRLELTQVDGVGSAAVGTAAGVEKGGIRDGIGTGMTGMDCGKRLRGRRSKGVKR